MKAWKSSSGQLSSALMGQIRLRPASGRVLGLLVLWVATGSAAWGSTLSGQVVDPQGLAVVDANVRLFSDAERNPSRPLHRVLSDIRGQFNFTDLAPGRYRLEVFAAGFQRQEQVVELGEEPLHLDIKLMLAGVQEGVVVTATRQEDETFDTPVPTALIPAAKLDRQLPVNLAQSLAEVPGVNWVNAGAFRSRPVIRGLESNRILVLVDGERLNNSRTATTEAGIETSLVDFSQIEQVEIVRGPGSVLYGSDAFGGVINIRTHTTVPTDQFRYGVRVRGEAFSDGKARRGRVELFASNRWLGARIAASGANVNDYSSPAGRVFRTGVDENSTLGDLRAYPNRYRSFFFKFLHRGAYDYGFPDLVANPAFLGEFPFSKLQKFSGGYQASYNSAAFSSVQLQFYYQRQNRDFLSLLTTPTFSLQSETITDVKTYGFDFQATSLAAQRHALTYGVTFYRDRSRDARTQILNPATQAILLSQEPSVPNSTLSGTGLFLQDQFAPSRRLHLSAGVRLDFFHVDTEPTPNFNPLASAAITQDDFDHPVTGNASGTFELRPGWLLTGQVARAFRVPNLFERYFFGRGPFGGFLVPNPDLEPETSWQFDLGTRVRHGNLQISLNYFLNRLRDQLVFVPSTFQGQPTLGGQPVFQNVNIDRSRIQGLESSAEWTFNRWKAQWTPRATVAWQRGSNLTQDTSLPFIAPFVSSVGLRWQPRQLRVWSEWRARITTGSDRVPPGFQPLSGFTVYGWRWGYEAVRGERGMGMLLPRGLSMLNFHFAFENFTNHLYRELFETVPQPGRSFRFGFDFTFDNTAR